MVEIKRIKRAMRREHFLKRILGTTEYDQLKERGFPIQSVAASFCAKEAFVKAVGTGFCGVSLKEIELLRDQCGKPYFYLSGKAQVLQQELNADFCVSVTHTKEYASAVVVAEKGDNDESVKL